MNQSAYQYYQSVKEKFHDICEPLLTHFDIRVAYLKFFKDNKYLFLNNYGNDEFTHLRFTEIHDDGQVFAQQRQKAKTQKSHHLLWPTVVKEDDHLMRSLFEADIWHGLSIINKLEDGDEIFSFVTSRDNGNITDFYINCPDVLNYFITYFKSKAVDLIDTSDHKKLAILKPTLTASTAQIGANLCNQVQSFMNDVEVDRVFVETKLGPQYLSKREFDSLIHVAQGKTAKEIARELDISPRTVETYLNKVKCKTGATLKSDLVKLLDGMVLRQDILDKYVPVNDERV